MGVRNNRRNGAVDANGRGECACAHVDGEFRNGAWLDVADWTIRLIPRFQRRALSLRGGGIAEAASVWGLKKQEGDESFRRGSLDVAFAAHADVVWEGVGGGEDVVLLRSAPKEVEGDAGGGGGSEAEGLDAGEGIVSRSGRADRRVGDAAEAGVFARNGLEHSQRDEAVYRLDERSEGNRNTSSVRRRVTSATIEKPADEYRVGENCRADETIGCCGLKRWLRITFGFEYKSGVNGSACSCLESRCRTLRERTLDTR